MEAKDYESLKRKLCKELEEIKERKNMGMAEIEIIDKLTHAIKNIEYIMEKEDGYSNRGYSHNDSYGSYRNSYRDSYDGDNMRDSYSDNNSSYRGRHYVRGHYSYADDSMRKIEDMIDDSGLSLDEKATLHKALDTLR